MVEKERDLQGLLQSAANEIDIAQRDPQFQFTPIKALGEQFGYTESGAKRVLQRTGITSLKSWATEQQRNTPPEVNGHLAWLLGYASGSNAFSQKRNLFEVHDTNTERIQKLQEAAKLGLSLELTSAKTEGQFGPTNRIFAHSKTLVERIGNLNSEAVSQTVNKDYRELLTDPQMLWKFIEGIFDKRAGRETVGIRFSITSETYAQFVLDILKKSGIENPKIDRPNGVVRGVAIRNYRDLNRLADNIRPIAEKQAALKSFRTPETAEVVEARRRAIKTRGKSTQLATILSRRKVLNFPFNHAQVESALRLPIEECERLFEILDSVAEFSDQDGEYQPEIVDKFLFLSKRLLQVKKARVSETAVSTVQKLLRDLSGNTGYTISSLSYDEIAQIADYAQIPLAQRSQKRDAKFIHELSSLVTIRLREENAKKLESNGCEHIWGYDPFHGGRMIARCKRCGAETIRHHDI